MLLPVPKRKCRRDYRQYDDDEYILLKNNKKKNTKKKKEVDYWGSVMPEILTEIAKRLPNMESFDYFSLVCRSWRYAAAACFASEFPHRKTTLEGPWLLLPGGQDKEEEEEEEKCFVISRRVLLGGTITRKLVELPPGVTKNHHDKQYFISCKDWLLVVSRDGDDATLVHPLSRVQIPLPSLATLRQHIITLIQTPADTPRIKIIHKFVLSADPFSTSDNDFFVMVIWGEYYLGFWKPKDTSWKVPGPYFLGIRRYFLGRRYVSTFFDLMYNRDDNKLYALDVFHNLAVCDIHGPNPTELHFLHSLSKPVFRWDRDRANLPELNKMYLVEWEKNTFLAVYHFVDCKENEHGGEHERPFRFETLEFVVHVVNLEDGTSSKVKHLGNKSLFLGSNSSFHVDCSEQVNKNIKPNCIYFVGKNYFMPGSWTEWSLNCSIKREVVIYSLSDRCFQYLLCYDNDEGVNVPLWFGPSF